MSTEFESLVRPFQSANITPAPTVYTPGQIGVPNVKMQLGRSGSGNAMTGSYSVSETYYMTKYETERKTPFKSAHHSQFVGKFGQGVIGQPMGGG
jgi:hypothetical protein